MTKKSGLSKIFGIVSVMFLSSPAVAQIQLSDDQAATVIDRAFDSARQWVVIGTVRVYDLAIGGQPGDISVTDLKSIYVPLANAGFLSLKEDSSAAALNNGSGSSWDQWLARISGRVTMIYVEPTDAGLRDNDPSKSPAGTMNFPIGQSQIEKIASNEAIREGIDEYRIVRVLYKEQFSKQYLVYTRMCGKEPTVDQKAIVLLKYDNFSDDWSIVAEDDANGADDICTKNVERALSQQ